MVDRLKPDESANATDTTRKFSIGRILVRVLATLTIGVVILWVAGLLLLKLAMSSNDWR